MLESGLGRLGGPPAAALDRAGRAGRSGRGGCAGRVSGCAAAGSQWTAFGRTSSATALMARRGRGKEPEQEQQEDIDTGLLSYIQAEVFLATVRRLTLAV